MYKILNLKQLNGMQLFGLFLICAMGVFFVVSFMTIRFQVTGSLEALEEDNTQVKMAAAEQYLVQYLKNAEETAFLTAGHNVVSSTLLGGSASASEIRDRLNIIKPVNGEHFFVLIDIAGQPIYQDVPLPENHLKQLSLLADHSDVSSTFMLFEYRTTYMLLIAVPVIYNEFQEGLLVYMTPFNAEQFFSPLRIKDSYWFGVQGKEVGMQPPLNWQVITHQVDKYDMALIYAVNPELFSSNQANFTQGLLIGITISVVISYFFVYFLGRTLLISPYKKLERSENLLERKTHDLIIKESQANRLARVARHTLDAIVITDVNSKITWVNQSFEVLSGYNFEEIEGLKPSEFLQGPQTDREVTTQIRTALDSQSAIEVQLINYSKSGDYYWVEMTLVPLYHEGTDQLEGFMAVERDITKQKRLEETLEQTVVEAQSANIAKSQFLAAMSHELRTPMNGVMGSAQLLFDTHLESAQRALLENLLDSSKHMLHLLNEILDFSKIEAGKLTLNLTPTNLYELTDKIHRSYLGMCEEKGLEFTTQCNFPPKHHYLVDEVRLTQIMMNLLNNAWKFTSKGRIELTMNHLTKQGGNFIELKVSDSGIGIPQDRQAHIFEPFTQADGNTTRKYGGTGLGLSIIAKLIEAMKGEITLESQETRGSCFHLIIPAEKVEVDKKKELLEVSIFDGSGLKALVVEDSKLNYIVLQQYLNKRGFQSDIAIDGQEGVDKAIATEYDLILMDNHMPILDGTDATIQIRKHQFKTIEPIIFACTADAYQENQQRMLDAGCNDLLTKPVNTKELDRALHQWLPSKTREDV